MFEAFTFKQKSVKSHNLLRKILKISHDDEADVFLSPLPSERRSQSTQTGHLDEEEILVVINDEANTKQVEHEKLCDLMEESDESNDVWQHVYLAKVDNEESIIDDDSEEIGENEIVESLEEETQDELTLDLADTIECEYCNEQVVEPLVKSHLKQHAKVINFQEFYPFKTFNIHVKMKILGNAISFGFDGFFSM